MKLNSYFAWSLGLLTLTGCWDYFSGDRMPQSVSSGNTLALGKGQRNAQTDKEGTLQQIIDDSSTEVKKTLGSTLSKDYAFPLAEGYAGSSWCECRDVGSSPHIGQDYNRKGHGEQSVAVANGKIVGVQLLGGGCGYAVEMVDGQGVLWRYLHLDKPPVSVGEFVVKGQLIGRHGKYPKKNDTRCLTGPHLHLERRTSGTLTPQGYGAARCENSPLRSCFADPVTPLKNQPQVGAKTTPAPTLPPKSSEDRLPACEWKQPIPQGVPTEPKAGGLLQPYLSSFLKDMKAEIQLIPARQKRWMIRISRVNFLNSNQQSSSDNICHGDDDNNPSESCIVRWELHARTKDGKWERIFVDQDIRNRPVSFKADYCWPTKSSVYPAHFRLVATTESGRILIQEGTLTPQK